MYQCIEFILFSITCVQTVSLISLVIVSFSFVCLLHRYQIYATMASFYVPLLVMVVVYVKILRVVAEKKKHMTWTNNSRSSSVDRNAVHVDIHYTHQGRYPLYTFSRNKFSPIYFHLTLITITYMYKRRSVMIAFVVGTHMHKWETSHIGFEYQSTTLKMKTTIFLHK